MVRKLVSKSVPIVHHITIPCSESLLVSSSEGTVVAEVPHLAALGTFLLFLGVTGWLVGGQENHRELRVSMFDPQDW